MINDKVDPFITQYRDALERQRDLSTQQIDNQRRNDFAGIMSGANTAGMMYSNFPQRSKIQYNTSTYQPNKIKIQDTYRTGLDKLRSNTINLYNQLQDINDAIANLNSSNGGGGGGGTTSNPGSQYQKWDYGNGYAIYALPGGQAIYTKDRTPISAGEFLENAPQNWNNWNDIWNGATKYYTDGVGSDTVDSYYSGRANRNNPDYKYLY